MSRKSPDLALERASLLGREFPIPLLLASGVAEAELADLFDAGVLVCGSAPAHARFADEALRRKTAKGVPWSRARAHHLAIADAARNQRVPAETVAAHYEAAQRFDLARAHWLRAGESACAAGDYKRALGFIDRCLALWPWDEQADDRVRVLREMARCAANSRHDEAARKAWRELADHAGGSDDAALHAEALHHLAVLATDPAQTSALLAEAAGIAVAKLPAAGVFRHGLAHVEHLANRVRVSAAKRALDPVEAAVRDTGDPAMLSEVLGWKGLLCAMAGEPAAADAWIDESLRIAVDHEFPEQTAIAYKRRANAADYAGEYALERDSHGIAIRYCREAGDGSETTCMSCLSYACFRTGEWKESLDTVRDVLATPELHRGLRAIALAVRGMVSAFRGERSKARGDLDNSLALLRAEGMTGMEFLVLWALAWWHDSGGDAAAAGAIYDEIRSLWRETEDAHDVIPGLLWAGAHYADHGRPAELADCIDILNHIRGRNDLPECRAALLALGAEQARAEGAAGRAEDALREAAALEAKAGLPLERLWIESRRTDPSGRTEALALAAKLGARPLMRKLGGDERPALTGRQREVLGHLAAGLTSKEIADRMNLSTRTVEMHVGRLLERMGCRTRPEAVATAQSRGWLP